MVDVLIFGGNGLLGQYLVGEAEQRSLEVLATDREEPAGRLPRVDLRDAQLAARVVREIAPKVVFLPAAMTGVDACEARPQDARQVNAGAPAAIAQACASVPSRLVYFSTDYVFDGEDGPYDEYATPAPVNEYGQTKLEGERCVLAAVPKALVVRTSANFGWNGLRGKQNSVTWILGKLRRGESVPLFTDQQVSPSYVPDVARVAFDLVDRGASGIFHVATRGCLTRLDMGQAVCDVFGLPKELLVPSRLAGANLPAKRPRVACLSTAKVERFLHIERPTFREALEHMRDSE